MIPLHTPPVLTPPRLLGEFARCSPACSSSLTHTRYLASRPAVETATGVGEKDGVSESLLWRGHTAWQVS